MTVGIAGTYGAGKNLAASVLEKHGFIIIDVDKLGHEALISLKDEVVRAFGQEILGPDGYIDRRTLGRIVFTDSRELARLESIVHPAMKDEVRRRITENLSHNVCINAALLVPMKLDELCDFIIWVNAPFLTRLMRARKRDGLSLIEAALRLLRQRSLSPQHSSRYVDTYSVRNSGKPGKLIYAVEEILSGKGL